MKGSEVRILTISPMYPDERFPGFGVFVHGLEKEISRNHPVLFIHAVRTYCAGSKFKRIASYLWWVSRVFMVGLFGRYDVIHAHTVYPAGFLAVLISFVRRKPVLITVHGSDICLVDSKRSYVKWMTRFAFRRANCVQVVSQFIKNKVIDFDASVIKKVFVQSMGVDTRVFFPEESVVQDDDLKLIFVGNLVREKGWKTAFKAVHLLHKRGVKCTLNVYGDGRDKKTAIEWIKKNKASQYICLHGAVKPKAVAKAMRSANVFIFPSMYEEAFSLVTAEALASGLPVVVSLKGALPELVKDKSESCMVENYEDFEAFADACERVIKSKKKLNENPESLLDAANSIWFSSRKVIGVYKKMLEGEK